MIEAGIEALLSSDTTLNGLIQSRIYPAFIEQVEKYPCLKYQLITAKCNYTFESAVTPQKWFQFDAWGTTIAQVKQIQAAVRQLLSAYQGTLADGTRVLGAFFDNETDLSPQAEARLYRTLSEYLFHYREP